LTHNTTQLTIASLEGNFKKILVICPASLKTNWKRELAFYAPEEQIGIVNGDEWVSDKKYTIINYDIASRFYKIPKEKNGNKEVVSRKKEVIEKCLSESQLIQANFDLVIIDEAHKLSNNTSNRFKTISDFLKRSGIKDIYLVTGTPITNKPINYYNILSLIKHPITFNWEKFIKRYCEGRKRTSKNGGSFWEAKGASNLEELKEKTKNAYIRRMKDEIPGLPSKTIREIYYDLSNKEKQEYDSVWEKYVEKKKAEGQNSFNKDLTELILLRQFISQKMISRTIEFINDKLEDEKKVFVACCFTDEINKLKEYYGDKCVIYNGQMTQKQKDKAVHEFMNNDNVMVFCGNIIASGVGLTLTSSHICVYNSFEWVPGNNSQMCDRIHRISQTKDVEIYYQLFTNTISEVIWNTVVKKEITIDKVIVKEDDK
jgi:SWI/SNF-related matrix-associated actin-dependent regulator 1 of chromatin subfamily A